MIDYTSRRAIWEGLIDTIEDVNIRAYFYSRVLPKIDWFHLSATNNKKKYTTWSVVSLFISALIPVVSIFSDGSLIMKVVLAGLGSAVTFISGYLMLHDSRKLWNWYSSAKDNLTRIALQYFTKTGDFVRCEDQKECDVLLVSLCEMVIGSVHELHNKTDKEDRMKESASPVK